MPDNESDSAVDAGRLKFGRSDGFLHALRERVDEYFRSTGRRPRDCAKMYLKSAIVIIWFLASYLLLVFCSAAWWTALPLAVSLGLSLAAVAFNIQHDGGHGAYSQRSWVNKLTSMAADLIGASSYLWRWKHAVFHHTYVNVMGHDTDIDVGRIARLSPHARLRFWHRWQQFYLWPLYGLMAGRWHLFGDFQELIAGKIGPHRIPRPRGWDLAIFIGGKLASLAIAFAVPLCLHTVWNVALFYLIVTGVLGLTMAVVFQLAHCVEEADYPLPTPDTLRMEQAWDVHQVQTTVDFGRKSWILCWLLGGLNFQIEHHLFPRICHVHYPALSKIVDETCREFGIRYASHSTFLAGVISHFRWLRRLGSAATV